MTELRQATQARHRWLDSQLALARPDAGLDVYLRHVRVMRDWLASRAPELASTGWGAGGLQAACRDLGEAQPPVRVPAPATGATSQAWGLAYVVEGSRLGGRVLLVRLRQAGVDHPMDFLQGEGADTGARWTRFLAALRAALATPEQVSAACQGACGAFDDVLARMQSAGLLTPPAPEPR